MRDIETNPYDAQEQRVCDYLQKLAPDIGCGNDPVGFLIASHAALTTDNKRYREAFERAMPELGQAIQRLRRIADGEM
mgnify:CR=1 FL=1